MWGSRCSSAATRTAWAMSILLLQTAIAQQPAATILKRVDDHYNHLKTLRAHFTERYAAAGATGDATRTESGTLLLAKPGLMRWSYDSPAGKLFLLDGHFAWSYTPGDPQASRMDARKLDDLRSPLRFLLGHTALEKELSSPAVTPTTGGFHIEGAPHDPGRLKLLSLDVEPTGAIRRLHLEDQDGTVTDFAFTDLTENLPVASKEFRFVPPPGVTIIDGMPPL